MQVKYIGAHDAVSIPLPYGGAITVKHGETVNVPDSIGPSLIEQTENWIAVKAKTKKDGEK